MNYLSRCCSGTTLSSGLHSCIVLVLHSSMSAAQCKERILEEEDEKCNSYDISDLCSDDSTDDELEPKKRLPSWATGQL